VRRVSDADRKIFNVQSQSTLQQSSVLLRRPLYRLQGVSGNSLTARLIPEYSGEITNEM
jgi:hypothetical protein